MIGGAATVTTTLEQHGADADGFVHPALFYRGAAEYLEGTVPFLQEGLASGEPVAVAVPGPNLRLILTELGTDARRVHSLDMTTVGRNPGRIIPGVLRAFADAHRTERVRIIGEPIWPERTTTEYPACAQHEALINFAFADRPVTILCPYDADRLRPEVLIDAEATHPLLIDAAGARNSAGYAPERVVAEYNLPLPPMAAPYLAFDTTTLAHARHFASEHATRFGLGGDHTELELIVGELTANSIAHGGGSGSLGIWAEDGHLVCEVRDAGHITDPLAGRRPAGRDQFSGRGLLLVNQLSDLVRVHTTPTGTTIRLYLALPTSGRHQVPPIKAGPLPSGPYPGPPRPRVSLRSQTRDALRTATRFGRYLRHEDVECAEPPDSRQELRSTLDSLAAVEALARVVELWRARLVRLARHRGARWAEIGRALGVSKQAAHERYSERCRRGTDRPGQTRPQTGAPDGRDRT